MYLTSVHLAPRDWLARIIFDIPVTGCKVAKVCECVVNGLVNG